ncbi:MAG: CehA/McbA family metallohydrolase [Dehalococcoidia bacterium]|nr:CehA/McbA family metallohydrolase [Dehalococcoidia bacterium]
MTAILIGALAFLVLPSGTSFVSAASAFTELQYWHAGDQHVHSEYSSWDASYGGGEGPTVEQQAQAAEDKGLSWIIMTDHNAMMTAQDWSDEGVDCQAAEASTGIKVMLGLEVGNCYPYFSFGHYLAYDIDYYVNPPNDCQSMINAVNQAGGFGFIAHPFAFNYLWLDFYWHDWDVTGYKGMEIMHAGTVSIAAINKWHDILKNNPSARVFGIGNSDAHLPGQVGNTVTYKYGSVSAYDVYFALRNGESIMSNGPLITFKMGGTRIGGTVSTTSAQTLDIAWDAQHLEGQQSGVIQKIEVYTNESSYSYWYGRYLPVKTIIPSQTETGYTTTTISVTAQTRYVRLKGIFSNGESYTNPIWINYGSGGGCPYLQVWDGSDYVDEGLLDIHNAEGVDVTYEHTVMTVPEPVNGAYQFRLIEHPKTISDIDQVQLRAILEDGTVQEFPLISARHSEDGNVLDLLLKSDDRRIVEQGADHNGGVSQSIDLRFAALGPHREPVAFIFTIEGCNMICKTC